MHRSQRWQLSHCTTFFALCSLLRCTDAQLIDDGCICGCDVDSPVRIGLTLTGNGQDPLGSDTLSGQSLPVYQALCLTVWRINQEAPFGSFGGQPLTVSLHAFDDHGSEDRAQDMYRMMHQNDLADIFLGPANPRLVEAVIFESEFQGKPLLVYANTDINFGGLSHAVGVVLDPRQYYRSALDILRVGPLLREHGNESSDDFWPPQTVGMIYDIRYEAQVEMCEGAASYAKSLGMWLSYEGQRSGIWSDGFAIYDIVQAAPDVVILCIPLEAVVEAIQAFRSLLWSPAALLFTQENNQNLDLTESLGAPNVIYNIVATSWHHSLNFDCDIWGNTATFVEAYRLEYGDEHPTEESARAVASLHVALQAVSNGRRIPTSSQIFMSTDVSTIFGRVRFNDNRTLADGQSYAFQYQAHILGSNSNNTELLYRRYLTANQVLLESYDEIQYPAPDTWEEREISIYPCEEGYQVRRTTGPEQIMCEPCQAGYERPPTAVSCHLCERNFYNTESTAQCQLCPQGSACELTPPGKRPHAAPGYYLMPQSVGGAENARGVYVACSGVCLFNNTCVKENLGVLCGRCREDHYNSRHHLAKRECKDCPHVTILVLLFLVVMLAYMLLLNIVVRLILSAATSAQAIHAAIVKQVLSHIQFIAVSVVACEIPVDILLDLGQTIMDPFEIFVPLECLFTAHSTEPESVDVFLGMALLPVILLCTSIFLFGRHLYQLRLARQQSKMLARMRKEIARKERDLRKRHKVVQVAHDIEEIALEGAQIVVEDVAYTAHVLKESVEEVVEDALHQIHIHTPRGAASAPTEESTPPANKVAFVWENPPDLDANNDEVPSHLDGEAGPGALQPLTVDHKTQKQSLREQMGEQILRWTILWVFVLQPVVVFKLVAVMRCRRYDVLRMVNNFDVSCDSPQYLDIYYQAVAGLAVFGFAIPWLEMMCVRHAYHRGRLMNIGVRRVLGFLFNGFEPYHFYFEMINKWAKAVFIVVASHGIRKYRVVYMLAFFFTFSAGHGMITPHDNRDQFLLDTLQFRSSISILAVLLTRCILDFRHDAPTSEKEVREFILSDGLEFTLAIVCICLEIWYWIAVEKGLIRNIIIKHLFFKKRVWVTSDDTSEESIDVWDVFGAACMTWVNALYTRTFGLLEVDLTTNKLDLTDLSSQERTFFMASLGDTMERFIESGKPFHPGQLSQAVNAAAQRCLRDRQARATKLYEIELDWVQGDGSLKQAAHSLWQEIQEAGLGMNLELEQDDAKAESDSESSVATEDFEDIAERNLARQKQSRIKKRRAEILAKAGESKLTVDELHNSLMLCWPEILEAPTDRLFKINKYELRQEREEDKQEDFTVVGNADDSDDGSEGLDEIVEEHEEALPDDFLKGEDLLKSLHNVRDDAKSREHHVAALIHAINARRNKALLMQEEIDRIQSGVQPTPQSSAPPSTLAALRTPPSAQSSGNESLQRPAHEETFVSERASKRGSLSSVAEAMEPQESEPTSAGGVRSAATSVVPDQQASSGSGDTPEQAEPPTTVPQEEHIEANLDDIRWTNFLGMEPARKR